MPAEASSPRPQRIHATALVIGEAGLLIRGPSGSGKSSLALALIERARLSSGFARLVGDDRVEIAMAGGRLLARPVAPLEGVVERRGLGLTPEPSTPSAILRLVVDILAAEPARMPEPEDLVDTLLGVSLPRLRVAGRAGDERLVLAALQLFMDAGST